MSRSSTPTTVYAEVEVKDLQANASALGLPIEILRAGTGREIDAAFANLVQKSGGALLVGPDAFFISRRAQIVTLAARHALPAIYSTRDFAEIGGLMSYGPNLADVYQQTGIYVGRVLKGEKPADLPVVQPTKFELVVNLNTARAIGLEISATAARARRRGDRVGFFLLHCICRLLCTPRRFAAVRRFGSDRSEADMPRASGAGRSDENDPSRKSS